LPAFQRRNWHLAYEVYEFIANRDALKIMSDNEARRAASLTVPGRMETFTFNGKTIILDGAHNSQKLAALYAAIQEKYPSQSIATLFGMIDEKFDTSIPKILMANESIIVTAFTINQDLQRIAMNPNTIAQELSMVPSVTCVDSPIAGLEELLDRQTDILLVTGSFFLVAAVRPYINDLASKKPH
jgi:dihydrofolate synthase / folylpolyglutamate synthase